MISHIFLGSLITLFVGLTVARPTEEERVRLWYESGNTWPPSWQESSDQHKAVMRAREEEIMAIPGADERWENWMQFVQGQMVPKFTTNGKDSEINKVTFLRCLLRYLRI